MKDIIKHFFEKVDVMQFLVAITIMFIFSSIVWALITKAIPPENKEALIHVLGIVEGSVTAIVMFYYGSSKGSQKKDEALKQKDELLLSKEEKPGVQITPAPGATTTTEVTTEH